MTVPARICLVTTGHPSTNPRLVKEANALTAAGHVVRVVAAKFLRWADAADAEFAGRPWAVSYVHFGEVAAGWERPYRRVRRAVARRAVSILGPRPGLTELALHYVVPELARMAAREPADLYIAHNLAALPAAFRAARRHGARLGFDAEDFHRGELPDHEAGSVTDRLVRWTEARYIPRCDYVTAASEGIASAYAEELGIPKPAVVRNVFPWRDREVALPESERTAEKPEGTVSLYWFSQTIGPERGLEDAIVALAALPEPVVLTLRGRWADGYEAELNVLAARHGVGRRVRYLPPAPPGEMVARAACHDVGLALEQPLTRNRQLCVTNKIYTYLLGGLPAVATDTAGQRAACCEAPEATRLVPPGDAQALARAVANLLEGPSVRAEARRAAERAARTLNWDVEQNVFLEQVHRVLSSG